MFNNKFITNLKTISKIKTNDKIHINNENYIIVEINSLSVNLYRRWNNINRHKNIMELKEIYNEIFIYINNQLDSKFIKKNEITNNLETERKNQIYNDLTQFSNNLDTSKNGLISLKETYNNDRLFESKVDNILLNIDNYIYLINKKINNDNENINIINNRFNVDHITIDIE